MLDKLKRQFPSLLVHHELQLLEDFKQFRMENGQYLSIHKNELTEQDLTLLSIFLTPLPSSQELSPEISLWRQLLLSTNSLSYQQMQSLYDINRTFRLIHFHLQTSVEQKPFEEAISSLSIVSPLIIWITEHSGVMVEQIQHESISIDELIDLQNAVTSDFYTDLYIYLGDVFSLSETISEQFRWESYCFELSMEKIIHRNIYQFYDIIPYILLEESSEKTKTRLLSLLKDIPKNELESIKVFIENGLNVSLAAKKLFMHRNSLQYRVDKFIEKTGVDIKSFEGAFLIYIAILGIYS